MKCGTTAQCTLAVSNQVEQIHKRTLRIIFPSLIYDQAMVTANLPSLHDRRSTLCNRLFHHMLDPSHKLNSLVPPHRVNVCNLRRNRPLNVPVCRTDRFHKSFVPSGATIFDQKQLSFLILIVLYFIKAVYFSRLRFI